MQHLGRILVVEPDHHAAEVVLHECTKLRRTSLVKSAAEAERMLERGHKLTALIMEEELPDGRGVDTLKVYRAVYPRMPMLMLTAWTEPSLINRVHFMRAEFVAKPAHRRNIRAFLQRAVAFERVPDVRVAHVVEDLVRNRGLSPRETDVLAAAIQGVPRKVIADQNGTTENTIKSTVRSILRKCDSSSLDEVARKIWMDALAGSDAVGTSSERPRMTYPPDAEFTIPPPITGVSPRATHSRTSMKATDASTESDESSSSTG